MTTKAERIVALASAQDALREARRQLTLAVETLNEFAVEPNPLAGFVDDIDEQIEEMGGALSASGLDAWARRVAFNDPESPDFDDRVAAAAVTALTKRGELTQKQVVKAAKARILGTVSLTHTQLEGDRG